MTMVGRIITVDGKTGVVTAWEPHGAAMCDALVVFENGARCWYGSTMLRPADDLGPLPSRHEAIERGRVETLASLHAIRAQHVREWNEPWPGCEYGKAIIGRAIDGAIADLEEESPAHRRKP